MFCRNGDAARVVIVALPLRFLALVEGRIAVVPVKRTTCAIEINFGGRMRVGGRRLGGYSPLSVTLIWTMRDTPLSTTSIAARCGARVWTLAGNIRPMGIVKGVQVGIQESIELSLNHCRTGGAMIEGIGMA